MKKGIVVACAAALAIAAGAAGWWLKGRGAADAGGAPQASGASMSQPTHRDPAQRAAWIKSHIAARQHLWREADYAEVRRMAVAGDALAQRRLSEIQEDCVAYLITMRRGLNMAKSLAGNDPASKAAVDGIYRDVRRLCPGAVAELRADPDAAANWLHRSARGGDLVAEMRFIARSEPRLSNARMEYFIGRIRDSGDPDAIFEMSLLLAKLDSAKPWPDPAQAPALQGAAAEQAWALAACRAGFDCLRGSRVMNLICLSSLACRQPDYLRHVVASASYPQMKPEIERRLAIIERGLLVPEP